MSGKHKCYVQTCSTQIRATLLMCAEHWAHVPKSVRREVYASWNAYIALVNDLQKSGDLDAERLRYLRAIKAAREAVEGAATGTLPRGADVV